MPEKKGTCRNCKKVGYINASEEYWHEGLCYNCILKEMIKNG